jgi:hypothetical protein
MEHDLIKKLIILAALAAVSAAPGIADAARRPAHIIRDSNGFTQTFRSEPSLHPPIIAISGTDPDAGASGDIFTDAQNSIQAGPMIIGPTGQLIWWGVLGGHNWAHDTAVQTYDGQTVLTYWESNDGGQDVILNHNYQPIAPPVRAGNGYTTGDHEFQITPQGTALITAYKNVPANLAPVGGPRNGTVIDDVIQEIDIGTGQVLWQWNPDAHLRWKTSYWDRPGGAPWDFTHVNSIQQLQNGNLLVSIRNTWAIYEISKRTGRILWTLGGKHSSFKMGPGTGFEWQHDARMQSDGTITLFDDASDGEQSNESQSRALRIRLDFSTHRASLVHAYTNRPPLLSESEGNVQVLPDGNTFVGWGSRPFFTEFSKYGGRQLFTVHFFPPLQSYRAYRFQWWGQPTTPPSIAAASTSGGTTLYASWNGATGVAGWQVLAGPTPVTLLPVEQFPSTSFETQMQVSSTGPYFAVQALDIRGQVLGTSQTIQPAP